MIDLHTHTTFSDGELIPAELVRRLEVLGYEAVCITDHADSSSLDFIVPRIAKVSKDLTLLTKIKVIPGIELTHVPPAMIPKLVNEARRLGAKIVVVHGETIVEPVPNGTNRAAIEAEADILAHPGLISKQDAFLAAEKGVYLEISGRKGHCFTNGHVVKIASETGAKLLLNSDAHSPEDLMSRELAEKIVQGAGLSDHGLELLLENARSLIKEVLAD